MNRIILILLIFVLLYTLSRGNNQANHVGTPVHVQTHAQRNLPENPGPFGLIFSDDKFSMLYGVPSSPECCPNAYSTSSGCVCMDGTQRRLLMSRGNNSTPYTLI